MYESNLFTIREKNHLLQKDVANLLGISQQTYSLYELGLAVIPLTHLNTLCNYYKVNIDYLIGLSNHKEYLGKTLLSLNKQLIGTRLKEVRMNHNISLRKLAKFLNTSPSTISAYENGKTMLLTAFAFQVCKTYSVSLDWLCGRL